MVPARVFRLSFLALLFASFCYAQYPPPQGYNQYSNHAYNQQQPYGQQSGNQQYQQQQQVMNRPVNGFGSPQTVQSPAGPRANVIKPKTGLVNKPLRTTQANANSTGSALVNVRLLSYSNLNLALPGNITCRCLPHLNCTVYGSELNKCKFSFSIILSAKDQSVSYISTDFFSMPDSGTMNTGDWANSHNLNMTSKPQSIDVIVHYHGVGMHMSDATMAFFNSMVVVDTFVTLLANYTPAVGVVPTATRLSLTGALVHSTLELAYSVQCAGNAKGNNCDLSCGSTVNSSSSQVICQNSVMQSFACTMDSTQQQVSNCVLCLNGADSSTNTCRSDRSVSLPCNRGVSSAFRTWTIVLGCLLGIAVIFIILLIVFYVIVRNQNDNRTTYRPQPYQPPSRPLLHESKDDEWERHRLNPPAALGRTTNADPELSRSSDQSESVRHTNGMTSPRREVAV